MPSIVDTSDARAAIVGTATCDTGAWAPATVASATVSAKSGRRMDLLCPVELVVHLGECRVDLRQGARHEIARERATPRIASRVDQKDAHATALEREEPSGRRLTLCLMPPQEQRTNVALGQRIGGNHRPLCALTAAADIEIVHASRDAQ